MIFALGFLGAGLLALLVLPALNARAERLARRRVEALFPMSIAELNAEKDHLRAEFAVVQRRLERQVEAAKAERHAEMEEMGRQTMRVGVLAGEVEQREIRVAALERDLASARADLTQVQAELNEARVARLAAEEALRALEIPYRRTLAELDQARGGREETVQALAEATTARDAAEARAREAQEALAGAGAGMAGTARDQIQALEDALASLTGRNAELEQRLATMKAPGAVPDAAETARIRAENAALERRIAEVADAVMAAPRPDPRLPAATPMTVARTPHPAG
jgi:chromosome segregation ATPase